MNEENDYSSDFFKSLLPSAKQQKKIDALMQIAAKIHEGIKAKGWNKSKFAQAMGQTNLSVITKWLSGTNNFQVDTLLDIQEVLGINLFDLEKGNAFSYRYETTISVKQFGSFNIDDLYSSFDQNTGSAIKDVLEVKNINNNSITILKV